MPILPLSWCFQDKFAVESPSAARVETEQVAGPPADDDFTLSVSWAGQEEARFCQMAPCML